MSNDQTSRLSAKIRGCTQSVSGFIENSRPVLRAAEDGVSNGSRDVEFIVGECDTIIGSQGLQAAQKFLALFLVKELSRKVAGGSVFAAIKSRLLDRLARLAMQAKGRPKIKECGILFNPNALGDEYEASIQFYQLLSECVDRWADTSRDSEFEMRRRELNACPPPVTPFVYFDRSIEDLGPAHQELSRAVMSQGPGPSTSGVSREVLALQQFHFSNPDYVELENFKREFLASVNNPSPSQDEVAEKLIMMLSVFEGKKGQMENAIATTTNESEVDDMLSLCMIMNTIQENANQISSVPGPQIKDTVKKALRNFLIEAPPVRDSRPPEPTPRVQNFAQDPVPQYWDQQNSSYNKQQNLGQNFTPSTPQPLRSPTPPKQRSPVAQPNDWDNQNNWASPIDIPNPQSSSITPPAQKQDCENPHNAWGASQPAVLQNSWGANDHQEPVWGAPKQPEPAWGASKQPEPGWGASKQPEPAWGASKQPEPAWGNNPQVQNSWGATSGQGKNYDIEDHDEVIKMPGASQSKVSAAEVELKNRQLKARKAELEKQIAELKKKEKEVASDMRVENSEIFRLDSDPKLLVEEISRKNKQYESLRIKYSSLLDQMSSRVRNDTSYNRSQYLSRLSGLDDNSGFDFGRKTSTKYDFKRSSQLTPTIHKSSYFY